MMLYIRLAWRNIWRHRRRTVIVAVAMAMGLSMMMLYDGMIDGFEQAIYGNAIKVMGGNIRIHAAGYSKDASSMPLLPVPNDQSVVQTALTVPGVEAANLRINTSGLVSNREGAFGVGIVGIVPEQEAPISPIAQHVADGRYITSADQDNILIGKGLAQMMNVKVGDRITLAGRSTHNQMRQRTMTIVGIYDLGVASLEKRSVYLSLGEAQTLYDLPGQVTEVVLTLKKLGEEQQVINALSPSLKGYEFASWAQSFPELQQAIGTKSGAMAFFGLIIMLIAGIGVLNLMLMAVYERTREIGLLAAMGLKPRQIMGLFVLEGTMLGLVGVVAGAALGLAINGSLGMVGLDYTQFSGVADYMALITTRVYPSLALKTLLNRALPVLVIAILASLYPAREASRQEPAESLHFV